MITKKAKTLKSLKSNLRKSLSSRILRVFEGYDNFSSSDIPVDAKGFSAHHSACKSAVSHAESLLRLTKLVEVEPSVSQQNSDAQNIIELITQARKEISSQEDEDKDDD